jgi:Lon protease-like protein
MVADLLAGTPEFGVVLIERGSEVGGGDVRTDAGCLARVVAAQEVAPQRWQLISVGVRRLRVERWLEDDPYPRADVADWDDPPESPAPGPERFAALVASARDLLALAATAGYQVPELSEALADDPRLGTYELAGSLPLGPLDRYRLLCTEGAEARADLLEELIADARVLVEAQLDR